MFYYLNGTVALLDQNLAVIDCHGVGYECHVSSGTLARLTVGKSAQLFTYCHIREDAFDLFGFFSREEKRCFELLLGVSGVGPKAALAILSAVSPEGLSLAVMTEDSKALQAAQGVGKKMAQRVILELRDKLGALPADAGVELGGAAAPAPGQTNKVALARAALGELGYSPSEIAAAMKAVGSEDLSVEEMVRRCLKQMVMG